MKKMLTLFTAALLTITASFAQADKRVKEYNLEKSTLAISGYDPVAYFTQSKAVEGDKNITLAYNGVTYRFSTAQNRTLFQAKPASYEPQYGGWCAYAMGAKGEKVEVDPETFKVLNGKLYLFYNSFFNNTLKTWNKDEPNLKTKADANWSKIFG